MYINTYKKYALKFLMPREYRDMLIDKRLQNHIINFMPPENVIEGLADFFSVFADTTRIKMISALAIAEMCVSDLSKLLKINQTTISHQLKNLKKNGIVRSRRQGRVVFYSLASDSVNEVMLSGVEHLGY